MILIHAVSIRILVESIRLLRIELHQWFKRVGADISLNHRKSS